MIAARPSLSGPSSGLCSAYEALGRHLSTGEPAQRWWLQRGRYRYLWPQDRPAWQNYSLAARALKHWLNSPPPQPYFLLSRPVAVSPHSLPCPKPAVVLSCPLIFSSLLPSLEPPNCRVLDLTAHSTASR
ncbi:hypothetical protein TgHK011_008271 [Trichoderma gracile]|nr:hypothetical protein TgHK011_008271 [Trichoderma gracile]